MLHVASVALGAALLLSVLNIKQELREAFDYRDVGCDAVIGAKGSSLQLVLNAVFHMNTSPGNIPYEYFNVVRSQPAVESAFPYAVGDNYRGYRIVGTLPYFFEDFRYRGGESLAFDDGDVFPENARQAVLGAGVARATGLRVGDHFHPTHGVDDLDEHRHDDVEFRVAGILRATNTPLDRVLFIDLESFYRIKGHGHERRIEQGGIIPEKDKELSAILVRFRDAAFGFEFKRRVDSTDFANCAYPLAADVQQLMDWIGVADGVLAAIAGLVLLLAGAGMFASLYSAMSQRRREIALLRVIGASRRDVMQIVLGEALLLSLLGCAVGMALAHAIEAGAAAQLAARGGLSLRAWEFTIYDMYAPLALAGLGLAAGWIPAWRAYRVEVARGLQPDA